MDSIFNRPPSISEETLEYHVYPSPDEAKSQAACAALGARIQSIVTNELLPKDFLWHRDAFEVKVVACLPHEISPNATSTSRNSLDKMWKLEGHMRVGDSVNDEWCVVWLFREICKMLDVVVSISDSDGEFLLIEAADVLPAWVSPSNAENRVWLFGSHLHLVPIFYGSSSSTPRVRRRIADEQEEDDAAMGSNTTEDDYLGISDALRLVRDASVDTVSPDEVQVKVWERIDGYPALTAQHVHRCRAYIPEDIALALHSNPSLVQRAVETFYTRDSVQLRAVHTMSRFPPSTSTLATVRLTRPAYAQLAGQNFHPPKIFGRWTEPEGSPEWKRRSIGMKIACGFEMLYAETKTKGQTTVTLGQDIDAVKETLGRDKDYQQYILALEKATFFRGELRGSSRWKELEGQAARTWLDLRRTDDASRRSFAKAVTDAIAATKNSPSTVTRSSLDSGEDSDDWLSIDADMLDGILSSQAKPDSANTLGEGAMEEDITKDQASRLQKLAGKVEAFVEGEGDMEGAKFEDDILSDEEFSDSADEDQDGSITSESEDEDSAELARRKKEATDKLVPPLPAEEYGVMPASYSNSQSVRVPTVENETTAASQDPGTERPLRRPILVRDRYDGVDSDDESDPDEGITSGNGILDEDDEETDEDRPAVVGDIEVDMEAEEEEFLRFSREALGISESQWNDILQDRSKRGAYVPSSATTSTSGRLGVSPSVASKPSPPTTTPPSQTGPNANLNSFEAVMQAMDEALRTQKAAKSSNAPPVIPSVRDAKGKGKAKPDPPSSLNNITEEETDIEEAMAAELKAALEAAGEDDDDIDGEDATDIDYNLIKNFLQSFKAQDGLSGPVSNLAGRLEGGAWSLPRDTS